MSSIQERGVREVAYATLLKSPTVKYNPKSSDARARRQAQEYVNGVTRQERWLNHIIDSSYTGSRELDPRVRTILQIGLYDMLFLSTPDYAAINETVDLVEHIVHKNVTGIVNAILRRIQREGPPLPSTGDTARDLAIKNSHPDWMVRRWIERYGLVETEALLEQNNVRPRHSVRINQLRTSRDEIVAELSALGIEMDLANFSDNFLYCKSLQDVLASEQFRGGLLTVQDESAGLVVEAIDPQAGQTIIDLCSAPGGKTTYMLERLKGEGQVFAVDKAESRLDLVRDSVQRLGLSGVEYHALDATEKDALQHLPEADVVLLDAPCSGLGVLSKRADMRWRRTEKQIRDVVKLQDLLIDGAAKKVAPGGLLVYSTCTIEPEENEQRITAFLDRNSSFQMEEIRITDKTDGLTATGCLRTLPHHDKIDGAFAAKLRRYH